MTLTLNREAARMVARFHDRWVHFLLGSSVQTLRRNCHELYQLEQVHRGYLDGQVLSLLRHHLEHAIQDIGGSKWTVERSLNDLRGRTRRRDPNRRPVYIDGDLQRAITDRLLPSISEGGHV